MKNTIKMGDVVFFRAVTPFPNSNEDIFVFKGIGFGILLGQLPVEFKGCPSKAQIIATLAALGFLTFDDLQEFIGSEGLKDVIKKLKEKYEPPKEMRKEPEEMNAKPPSNLVGLDGRPLSGKPTIIH